MPLSNGAARALHQRVIHLGTYTASPLPQGLKQHQTRLDGTGGALEWQLLALYAVLADAAALFELPAVVAAAC